MDWTIPAIVVVTTVRRNRTECRTHSVVVGPRSRLRREVDGVSINGGTTRTDSDIGMPSKDSKARDRKSTRLNSSHGYISYAVFCLKKKKKKIETCTNSIINNER